MQRFPADHEHRLRLARTLRELRDACGLTQEAVATRAKITKNYVSDLENGQRNPTFLVLNRVLVALETDWPTFARRLEQPKAARKAT